MHKSFQLMINRNKSDKRDPLPSVPELNERIDSNVDLEVINQRSSRIVELKRKTSEVQQKKYVPKNLLRKVNEDIE